MLPSELLDHFHSLLPDVSALFEVDLLDALPPNARDAALQQTSAVAMAKAADLVVLGNRAQAAAAGASVNALTLDSGPFPEYSSPSPVSPVPAAGAAPDVVAAVSRAPRPPLCKTDTLCAIHARWGKEAYKCQSPNLSLIHI